VFFSVLSNDLSTLNYSTYLAGSDDDEGYAVTVDESGLAYLTGAAGEYFLPYFCDCESFQDFYNGGGDAFFIVLDPTVAGNGVEYATYFGGYETDAGLAIALDPNENVFIGGVTFSTRDDTLSFRAPTALQLLRRMRFNIPRSIRLPAGRGTFSPAGTASS